MPKFRKKPVVIDAVKASEVIKFAKESNCNAQEPWIWKNIDNNILIIGSESVLIKTLEGIMTVEEDDYIIRGVKGEIYPCKPDIFEQTYDIV